MRNFQTEFANRKSHLKRYLSLVSKSDRAGKLTRGALAETGINVLRAGTFLVLYNLIEASARTAIESIHDELSTQQVPFQLLKGSLRKEVVRSFKKNSKPDVQMNMANVQCEFVTTALSVEDHFSGNVDARLLRQIAAIYGFSWHTNKRAKGGIDLLTIKDIRNDLAHGLKSYDEVGREYPAKSLLAISICATSFVEQILANVATFLDEKRYLEINTENAA